MIPFPAEEILPTLGLMLLRLGVPVLALLMLGSLAQRAERRQV
jgi:hypothetical protein